MPYNIYMAQIKKLKKNIAALRIGPQGRVVIPASLRKEMGVSGGDTLVAWIENNRLIMESREKVEEDLWERFRRVKGSLTKDLIKERRKEAKRENQS
jgi:AbrB family looped-hinge helix DNA binding protein